MKDGVPLVVSLDVHSYPATEREVPRWLEESLKVLDRSSIKATFFFPAVAAEQFADKVKAIFKQGHEIGCHGLTHGAKEQYNLMSYEAQKATLREAKERIEQITAQEIISFRAPVFKISAHTVRALEETGFKIDSSVNSQRLGILSSEIMNVGWMYAPRRPYHPSLNNPFVVGKSSLWEIPLSAFIFPFVANTGMAFGGTFMKWFFRMLYAEASFMRHPIVYQFHPEDIYPKRNVFQYRFDWRHLLPSRKRGFEIRSALFHNKNPKAIAGQIIGLLETMKRFKKIQVMTYREMLHRLETKGQS